jgi:SAM-dependent methyltransferase
MTSWVLGRIPRQDVRRVLDVGCGGGGAIKKLARLLPDAELHGVDHSPESVKVASRTNNELIRQGRAFVRQNVVSDLPFGEGHFDLVLAIESHIFWPHLERDLMEVRRVLADGGTLVLGGAEYFGGRFDSRNRRWAAGGRLNCQTLAELCETVVLSGYEKARFEEDWRRGWFCVLGTKPGSH